MSVLPQKSVLTNLVETFHERIAGVRAIECSKARLIINDLL